MFAKPRLHEQVMVDGYAFRRLPCDRRKASEIGFTRDGQIAARQPFSLHRSTASSIYGATQALTATPSVSPNRRSAMSNLEHRAAARITSADLKALPLVPEHIRAQYGDALTRIPHVRVAAHKVEASTALPSVGSFFG